MTYEEAVKRVQARWEKGGHGPYWEGADNEALRTIIDHGHHLAVLPPEPTAELLGAMYMACNGYNNATGMASWHTGVYTREYKALYAALTTPPKPKTKHVECYTVQWYSMRSNKVETMTLNLRHNAQHHEQLLIRDDKAVGAHIVESAQEVPA